GPERAAQAARAALEGGARALVSWGLAGGLDPALAPGAVVVPSAVLADGACFPCDADWAAAVRAAARDAGLAAADGGTLLGVAVPLATPSSKAHAYAETGAVAADMESGAIAA